MCSYDPGEVGRYLCSPDFDELEIGCADPHRRAG
jgi:hypothetical protein